MRRIIFLCCLTLSLAFTACLNEDFSPETWSIEPELAFSKSGIILNSTVGTDTIAVFTNYENYEVSSSEDWCDVQIDKMKSTINISVKPNFNVHQRMAIISVTISRGNRTLSKDISIVQMGGIWETIGDFSVYWGYEISDTQRKAVSELLESLVFVEGGNFTMGYENSNSLTFTIPHDVALSSFYISKFELSQKQWNAIMAKNPSQFKGENLPVENISWADALEFVTRLSKLTQLDIRLPTEAQWEYAAKGGKFSLNYIYPGSDDYTKVANYCKTTIDDPNNRTMPGGKQQPNEIGLYDMAGNVAEFCSDWYEYEYVGKETKNPQGPETGSQKVVRGGSLLDIYPYYRSVYREFSKGIDKVTPFTGIRIIVIP